MAEKNNHNSHTQPPTVDEGWWAALLSEEDRYQPSWSTATISKNQAASNRSADVDWSQAKNAYQQDEVIYLQVSGYNRGGLLVEGGGLYGFVPISHLVDLDTKLGDEERDAALAAYEGTTLCLKIIECCPERGRVVLSQRAAQAGDGQRNLLFDKLSDGDHVFGCVTNVTDFGAFVDLGGVEGLIHVSELSWGRVRHPGDIVKVGQKLETMIINLDQERGRVALSLKRLHDNPWETAEEQYLPDQEVEAVITSVVSFGAFARLEDGLDGLIHVSTLNNHEEAINPRQILDVGQQVRVRILHVDAAKQRLGLSLVNSVGDVHE